MASKEELEAMGIVAKECKECCRDISEEEYNKNKGYCNKCYLDRRSIENQKNNYNYSKSETFYENETSINTVAKVIKILAIINAICGVILGLIGLEEFEVYAIVFIVASVISSVFVYAIGEIIQLLEDIKNK